MVEILNKNGEVMCTLSFINSDIYYKIKEDMVRITEIQCHKDCEDGFEEWVDTDIMDTETGEIICQFHGSHLYYFANNHYMLHF